MLRDTEQQIHTRPIGAKFVGDVVLTPRRGGRPARLAARPDRRRAADRRQLAVPRQGRAAQIASPLLTLQSRFDAPGVVALSADAFVTPPVEMSARRHADDADAQPLRQPQDDVAARAGGRAAGSSRPATRRARRCVAAVQRGALVGRLSMGNPAANGDFSGVIKNSFVIDGGQRRRGAVGGDDQRQHGAHAARRRGGQPRAARHRRTAAAVAAHRRAALLLIDGAQRFQRAPSLMTTPRPTSTSAGLADRAGSCAPAVRQARTVHWTVRVRAHPPRGRGPAWERPGARPAEGRLTLDVSCEDEAGAARRLGASVPVDRSAVDGQPAREHFGQP